MHGNRICLGTALALGASLLPLGACASTVHDYGRDPGLDAAVLAEDGLAVGGLVSRVPDDAEDDAPLDAETRRLEAALRTHSSMRRDALVAAAGAERVQACLEHPSAENLTALGEALGDRPRYLLVSRIEGDSIDHHADEVTEPNAKGQWKEAGSELVTTREVLMSFDIYDLRTGRRVLWASISSKAEETCIVDDDGSDTFLGMILLEDGYWVADYPEPPERSDVVALAAKRLAALIEDGE